MSASRCGTLRRHVTRADAPDVARIAVDETAAGRGHDYITYPDCHVRFQGFRTRNPIRCHVFGCHL
jgi:hypothetical protein